MNSVAQQGIYDILTETNTRQGWSIPSYVIDYECRILAERMNKNPWQPEPSYAARYLTASRPSELLELGNLCWFTRAVFPELGQRRGIKSSYYVDLGQSCYSRVLDHSRIPAVEVMCRHFEFCAEAVLTAIRHHGEFRSMWDFE